jgi:hypothetical protein
MYTLMGFLHARLLSAAEAVWSAPRRLGGSLAGQRGQGTVEYIALILLVALIMAGVVLAMKNYKGEEGKELAGIVLTKIKEAVRAVKF